MPNQGKNRKSRSVLVRGQHVLVTASLRFDGRSEVADVVIVGTGKWRRPIPGIFETLDAAIDAGMAFALSRFDAPPAQAAADPNAP